MRGRAALILATGLLVAILSAGCGGSGGESDNSGGATGGSSGNAENGWAGLSVSDTGIGISYDQLPLVFERFHRADPSRADGGAGLGLSIARQIAESHGGKIKVESTPGEGSTFMLLLPKKLPAARP